MGAGDRKIALPESLSRPFNPSDILHFYHPTVPPLPKTSFTSHTISTPTIPHPSIRHTSSPPPLTTRLPTPRLLSASSTLFHFHLPFSHAHPSRSEPRTPTHLDLVPYTISTPFSPSSAPSSPARSFDFEAVPLDGHLEITLMDHQKKGEVRVCERWERWERWER